MMTTKMIAALRAVFIVSRIGIRSCGSSASARGSADDSAGIVYAAAGPGVMGAAAVLCADVSRDSRADEIAARGPGGVVPVLVVVQQVLVLPVSA